MQSAACLWRCPGEDQSEAYALLGLNEDASICKHLQASIAKKYFFLSYFIFFVSVAFEVQDGTIDADGLALRSNAKGC